MEVIVLPKALFDLTMKKYNLNNENVEIAASKIMFISINDTCGTPEVPYFENRQNVKVLFFDDISEDLNVETERGIFVAKAFTEQQAIEIIDFIEKNKDKRTCIVHCAAGISRSGAVGTFVNDYFSGNYGQFKKTNPHIHPNAHVLRILNRVLRLTLHC